MAVARGIGRDGVGEAPSIGDIANSGRIQGR